MIDYLPLSNGVRPCLILGKTGPFSAPSEFELLWFLLWILIFAFGSKSNPLGLYLAVWVLSCFPISFSFIILTSLF